MSGRENRQNQYKHPILPFRGKALSYLPDDYKEREDCVIRIFNQTGFILDRFLYKKDWKYEVTTSPYVYRIYEMAAVNPLGTPASIIPNWNGTGSNIDVTINSINLRFLVKEGIPIEAALENVMESLKESKLTKRKNRSVSQKPADRISLTSESIGYPLHHKVYAESGLFPEIILINEINNDFYLTYSMFKAFRENYLSNPEDYSHHGEVALSYIHKKNKVKKLEKKPRHFVFLNLFLILMVHGLNSDAELIAAKLRREFDPLNLMETKSDFKVEINGKQYVQKNQFTTMCMLKSPDVQIFTSTLPDNKAPELPSYYDAGINE